MYPTPKSARRETPPQASLPYQVLGAVAGAVATLLITSNLGKSPWANLLAAAAGAAIGPVASYRSRRRRLPLGLCLIAIAIGLTVTYTSVKVVDAARDTETLPGGPGQVAETPTVGPTEDPTAHPTAPTKPIRVEASPTALRCTAAGCDSTVTLASVGRPGLETAGIGIEGDAPTLFEASDDCADRAVDSCEFAVAFKPTSGPGTVTAKLVIHHNGEGSPVTIPLEGVALGDLSITEAGCRHEVGPVEVSLAVAAPTSVSEVPVRLGLPDGTVKDETIAPGQPVTVSIEPTTAPDGASIVTVTLDPDGAMAEDYEDNNTRELTCTLVRDHR